MDTSHDGRDGPGAPHGAPAPGSTAGGPAFDSYDPALAELLTGSGAGAADGLTAFLGVRVVAVEPGRAVLELDVGDELVHGFGAAHGGVVATLVDHALGAAVFPLVPAGTWPATLEFKLNYLAPIRGGTVRAISRVLSLRRRSAVVQVDVEIVEGARPVAAALGTISLNPPPGSGAEAPGAGRPARP